ncbi:MAG TPA: DivIVA domain-containing protein [Acidimicrobiales bacterium]|nr:DivIVA domain-containing protein [Acidimicrobiales bacterium]
MPEDRVTIASTARMHPDEVARHTFATTRRGFDPAEVRAFLEHVARELSAAADREHEMRRAVADAEHRAANPVLDEATLTAALGQETARVLRSAHDAAAELVARADSEALRLRTQAQEEADQLQRRTEQNASERAAQSEAAATELRRRAQEEAAAKLEGAKLEAEALMAQARAECRAMVQEAQELRARVLADLARRRRVLHSQIEQLRAGRERLAETIGDVRHAVDTITDELFRAEDEARLAAEAAGRQAAQEELSDVAGAEVLGVAGAEGEPGPAGPQRRPSVDELFARLRAEAHALAGPAGDPPAEAAPSPAPGGNGVSAGAQGPDAGRGPARARGAAPAPGAPPGGAGEVVESVTVLSPNPPRTARPQKGADKAPARSGAGGGGVTVKAPGRVPAPSSAAPPAGAPAGEAAPPAAVSEGEEAADGRTPDPVVARRDEVLGPLVAALARRLKRALQDDQNDVLDRLRAKGGWAPGVLPTEEEHTQRYVRAVALQLIDVARAGAGFAGGKADEAPGVEDVARELASDIVSPLRRRLEDEGPSVESGDEAALVELVGAAYREWKGARTERLAGDHAVYAFGRAALAAVPVGTPLRWVVDDGSAQCPDCDDNALAGPVPSGESFPTGHPHPPAHAGCRCLLTPADA